MIFKLIKTALILKSHYFKTAICAFATSNALRLWIHKVRELHRSYTN